MRPFRLRLWMIPYMRFNISVKIRCSIPLSGTEEQTVRRFKQNGSRGATQWNVITGVSWSPPPTPTLRTFLNGGDFFLLFTVWLLITDGCNWFSPYRRVHRILTPILFLFFFPLPSRRGTGRCYWCNQFPGGTRRRPRGHLLPLCGAEEAKSAERAQACHESRRPGGDAAPRAGWFKRQQVACAAES